MQEDFRGYHIHLNEKPYSLFKNESVQRQLDSEFVLTLCEYLCERKLGEWLVDKSRFLFYRFPIPVWGDKIHEWAVKSGKINSIESAYSVIHGDDSEREEFHSIPHEIFLHALRYLQSKAKCELVGQGSDLGQLGVKFFH